MALKPVMLLNTTVTLIMFLVTGLLQIRRLTLKLHEKKK